MLSYEYCISKGTIEEVLVAFWGGPSTLKMLLYKWAFSWSEKEIIIVHGGVGGIARRQIERPFGGGLYTGTGANGDREIFICPVQLTTSRIGNLTRLIHTLAIRMYVCMYVLLYV